VLASLSIRLSLGVVHVGPAARWGEEEKSLPANKKNVP
jgi:hypothetical protein